MDLDALQREILDEMVPSGRFDALDAAAIARHTDLLLAMEDDLVAGFYDRLEAHPPTAAIFAPGERPAREATLRGWWQRTVTGPLDDRYWAWMALVGVVHIRRGVRNPMMLSMITHVEDAVGTAATAEGLATEEADALRRAFGHLGQTVSAVIAEAYTQAYVGALQELAGLNPRLLANMLTIEIQAIEDTGRASLR